MECPISRPVGRIDVPDKLDGKAKYIGDIKFEGMVYARTLRSNRPRAIIKSIEYPDIPEGYYIVDKNDVPGINSVKIIGYDMPVFATDRVNYVGEPISLIVGPDKEKIMDILSNTKVIYEDLEPILTIEEGLNAKSPIFKERNLFADYRYSKGDIEKAVREAKFVYEGEYETGYQEQMYLEPQGMVGEYDGCKVTIYGSLQCPYYIKRAVEECLNFKPDNVRVVQLTTGGAFGGKEDYPSLLGCQVACAAIKVGAPVQLILERDEDIQSTTKRHPSKIRLKSYLDENYRIIGVEADVKLDAGAYEGLSRVVLQRAIFAAIGVYNVENIIVTGKAVATNKAVSGAFRGFGGPQAFFAVEMHMEHMAKRFGIDSIYFRKINFLKKGDKTSTGGIFRDEIMLPQMLDRVLEMSSYYQKKKMFKEKQEDGKLRGIGLSMFFHGGGFTGSGERDLIKGKVKLIKNEDETVEILIANVEMGQGAQTTMRKIVAYTLGIPLSNVIFKNPDTDRVPDSGPTVASRTTVITGRLLKDAAEDLKKRWNEKGMVEIQRGYTHPDGFEWNDNNFKGDAYTSYSWGANVVEVELDPVTYESTVKGAWGVYDIGAPIDERIVKGQIEGGMLQGLGYGSIEVMENRDGIFQQASATDYTIPTSMDAPRIESELICQPYEGGPYGAKGLGELPLVGVHAAYAIAIEDAAGVEINKIPVRPEYLMEVKHCER